MTVEQPETAPEGISLSQIVAILERAGEQAREQGSDFSPTVAQAAVELDMLYATYTMQLSVSDEKGDGPRVEDVSVGQAVQVSYEQTSVVGSDATRPQASYVTYTELVTAAVRLASMLDAPVPIARVEVHRAQERPGHTTPEPVGPVETWGAPERQRLPLRESLLDAVTLFGGSTAGYANGRIPAVVLCPLEFAPGHMVRCDAAERLTALSDKFEREFGYAIPITDSYRSYAQQVAVASAKPHLAAVPGTSNHGWGLAVDLSDPIAGGASREYVWLRVHGPHYGWDNPSWARLGGAKPEPWHFEFFAAGSVPNRAVEASDVGTWDPAAGPSEPPAAASPRHKPASGPARGDSPTTGARKPTTKPEAGPPSQKPSEPASKPKPKPSDPKPKPSPSDPKPAPSDPKPTPSPSPSPTPSDPKPAPSEPTTPTPRPTPEPSPAPSEPSEPSSPAPSEPSSSPSPTSTPDRDGRTPPTPVPSTSPSVSPTPLSRLARGLDLSADDSEK
ncbi:M15 family metallopeptidase [Promicromonospora vindobonensis]|uniref:M15 family metallopeptidase n=1 Tax=Promicromonospora vindobonensis TaxID=195748 RepID=A0ABW5VMJ8_9MICO